MSERTQTPTNRPMHAAVIPAPSGTLQRQSAREQHASAGGESEECKQKREVMLQRAAINPSPVHQVPAIVHGVLRSSGHPLDAKTRAFMEPRFGYDFSGVRVHTDAKAAESARAVNALAYTVGRDIVFDEGLFVPSTRDGRRLLAHELAHVAQQSQAFPGGLLSKSDYARNEAEARQAEAEISVSGVRTPLAFSPAAMQVACANGQQRSNKSFRATPTDIKYLESTLRQLMNELDVATRDRILKYDTVAVGLVVDSDGKKSYAYTVAGNRTYPSLPAAAAKLGIDRWTETPRAKGRGAVGAPGDAEQIFFVAGETRDAPPVAIAVTRKVCLDCVEAADSEVGGVPVFHVRIARTKAPTSGRKGATHTEEGVDIEGPAVKSSRTKKATPQGAETAEGPSEAPTSGRKGGAPTAASEDIEEPVVKSPPTKNVTPRGAETAEGPTEAPTSGRKGGTPTAAGVDIEGPVVKSLPTKNVTAGGGATGEGPRNAPRLSGFRSALGGRGGMVLDQLLLLILELIAAPFLQKIAQEKLERKIRELQPQIVQQKKVAYSSIGDTSSSKYQSKALYYNVTMSIEVVHDISVRLDFHGDPEVKLHEPIVISSNYVDFSGPLERTGGHLPGSAVIRVVESQTITYSEPVDRSLLDARLQEIDERSRDLERRAKKPGITDDELGRIHDEREQLLQARSRLLKGEVVPLDISYQS